MTQTLRTAVAAFDALAMAALAYTLTGGFGHLVADLVLWGSAAAAAVCAFVVATSAPAAIAWVAIGYIFFAGLLVPESPQLVLIALAIALMPVVPRVRSSLAIGIAVATVSAFAWRLVIELLLRGRA